MSTHRNPRGNSRISRAQAEHLLDTGAGGPELLSALIRAAAAPTAVADLVGEHAALAEFRAARLSPTPSPRRQTMLSAALAKLLAAKVAAASAAAAATGGLALAAATGHLPAPLQDAAHSAFGAPAPNSSVDAAAEQADPTTDAAPEPVSTDGTDAAGTTDSNTTEAAEPTETTGTTGTTEATETGSPTPSLNGLCKAFRAGATANPKVLANPAFSVLVTAAGGADSVADYCVTLIGPVPSRPVGRPTDVTPGGPPSTRPAAPSARPSAPAAKPSHAVARPSKPAAGKPSAADTTSTQQRQGGKPGGGAGKP